MGRQAYRRGKRKTLGTVEETATYIRGQPKLFTVQEGKWEWLPYAGDGRRLPRSSRPQRMPKAKYAPRGCRKPGEKGGDAALRKRCGAETANGKQVVGQVYAASARDWRYKKSWRSFNTAPTPRWNHSKRTPTSLRRPSGPTTWYQRWTARRSNSLASPLL